MADEDKKPDNKPLIIKKVKKVGGGGGHGGAWKVAYADFVTAMMAFFLLLWLLNATTEDQKRGIADYFSPTPGEMRATTGGSGFFRGDALTSEGPQIAIPIPTMSFEERTEEGGEEQETEDQIDAEPEPSPPAADTQEADTEEAETEEAERMLAEREERQFAEAEETLRQAIQDVPELRQLAESLIIDRTPEGLRIQIVDQEKYAMFPRGSAMMHDTARKLMARVTRVVQTLPQKISVTGHTDATPYVSDGGYDNWDLSTDRANSSRRALVEAGLSAERVVHVTGKADQEPLVADDPTSPRNRRISIVLLREQKTPLTPPGEAPAP
jgi:chemotaxis protein MotB